MQCFSGIPEADLKNIYHQTVTVKAKQAIDIDIPITGKPLPSVNWIVNEVKIKGNLKHYIPNRSTPWFEGIQFLSHLLPLFFSLRIILTTTPAVSVLEQYV